MDNPFSRTIADQQPAGRRSGRYGRSMLLSAAFMVGGALAIGAIAQPAAATEPSASCRIVSTGGSPLNIRSSASSTASIVATIAKGKPLDVTGERQNGWVRVRANVTTGNNASRVVEGWVDSSFLRPCVATTPPNTCRVVSTGSLPLNIRSSASNTAAVLGTIAKGQKLETLGPVQNGWVRVRATAMTGRGSAVVEGWVASSFLRPCTVAAAPQDPVPNNPNSDLCRRVVYREGLAVYENPDMSSARRGGVLVNSEVSLVNRNTTTAGGAVWMQISQPIAGWIPVRSLARPANQLNLLNCR
ncbi:MAG TPA: SH3 domain-containing protein [Coleofasciculaceae cyanobacterium]